MKYIKQHKNFFDSDVFCELINYSSSLWHFNEDKFNIFGTNHVWPENIVMDSNTILIHKIQTDAEIFRKISGQLQKKINIVPVSSLIYFFTPGSHIPWHSDNIKLQGAISVYLNDTWDKNNGGLFHYDIEGEIKTIVPEKNLAIQQFGIVPHSVSCLTRNSQVRVSLQIWY